MALKPEAVFSCLRDDLSGFDTSNGIWPNMSIQEAAAVSLSESFRKKFLLNEHKEARTRALDKFLASNQRCLEWTAPVIGNNDYFTEMFIGQVRQVLHTFWNTKGNLPIFDNPLDALENARVGPGESIGSPNGSFYSKLFASNLSCSDPSLYHWYRHYIKRFPYWDEAEITRTSNLGGPSVVLSSRLSFVPKNDEIARCICVEPVLNTFFQLGFKQILEERLRRRFGISLDRQPFINRDLACLGSITDGLSTLDLSSASDSISIKMLEHILPKDFVLWLKKFRTPNVDIKGRGTEKLHMISTMGNGYTFPLQTIIFSAVVVACLTIRGLPERGDNSETLWSVFGDDIIVPRLITRDVISGLATLGFSVNNDKSFSEGPFRESCGEDFYKGSNIRGVYLKEVDTMASRFSAINQLVRFSSRTGVDLPKTLRLLKNSVDDLRVPRWEDMSAGIHVPYSLSVRRRSKDYQSPIYSALRPLTRYLSTDIEGLICVPSGYKRLTYNPAGLWTSFLQGSLKGDRMALRDRNVRWRLKRRLVAPNWDYFPCPSRSLPDYGVDWQRWETVVHSSLF